MLCSNCGANLPSSARICPQCGAPTPYNLEKHPPSWNMDDYDFGQRHLEQVEEELRQIRQERERRRNYWRNLDTRLILAKVAGGIALVVILLLVVPGMLKIFKTIRSDVSSGAAGTSVGSVATSDSDSEGADPEKGKAETKRTDYPTNSPTPRPTITDMPTPTMTPTPTSIPTPTMTPTPIPTEKPHEYIVIMEDCTWGEAFTNCISRGGHLVTLDTDDEIRTVLKLISKSGNEDGRFYIGAARSDFDYYWVDGEGYFYGTALNHKESPAFSYWMKGEPSYEDAGLNLSEYYVDLLYFKDESRWVINDIPDDLISAVPSWTGRIGYICEFD